MLKNKKSRQNTPGEGRSDKKDPQQYYYTIEKGYL